VVLEEETRQSKREEKARTEAVTKDYRRKRKLEQAPSWI
jgi:hypothetical protein